MNKKAKIAGYIFISIMSLCKGFALNSSSLIYYLTAVCSMLFLMYKTLYTPFTKKEVILYSSILGLAIVTFFLSGRLTIIFTVLLIISCKGLNLKEIIKVIFFTRLISFGIMVVLSSAMIIPSNDIDFYRNGELIYRHAFGYSHPNEAGMNEFVILSSGVLLLDRRWKRNLYALISVALIFVVYQFTWSRTSFIMCILFCLFSVIVDNFNFIKKIFMRLSPIIYLMPILITFIFVIGYGRIEFLYKIDQLLTSRVMYVNKIFLVESPRFIGAHLDYNQIFAGINIDNGTIKIMYHHGVIWFIVYTLYNLWGLIKSRCNMRYSSIYLVAVFMAFYGLTEGFIDNAMINYTLLCIPFLIKKGGKKTYEEADNIYSYI